MLIFVTLFCSPFVLVGLGLAAKSFASARKAHATGRWQATPAQLQSCQVRAGTDSDGDATYDVDVHYTYRFEGRDRESRTLTHASVALGGADGAAALCARLLAARNLTAYVNPEQPDEAVLLAGSSLADYTGVAFGLTFAGFAVMFVIICALGSAAPDALSLLER